MAVDLHDGVTVWRVSWESTLQGGRAESFDQNCYSRGEALAIAKLQKARRSRHVVVESRRVTPWKEERGGLASDD